MPSILIIKLSTLEIGKHDHADTAVLVSSFQSAIRFADQMKVLTFTLQFTSVL